MPDSPSTKAKKEPNIHNNDDNYPKNPKSSKKHEEEEPEVVEVLEDEKSKLASSWPQALQDLKARGVYFLKFCANELNKLWERSLSQIMYK